MKLARLGTPVGLDRLDDVEAVQSHGRSEPRKLHRSSSETALPVVMRLRRLPLMSEVHPFEQAP